MDGTGWIPVNFKSISYGSPLGGSLPADPTNSYSSGYYYTYTPGTGAGQYALTAVMESQKYLTKAGSDGGYDPSRYEIGTDLSLVAQSEGLVGWWAFDEGSGSTAKDSSGNGNDGTLVNSPSWVASCKQGGCLSFVPASSQYVNIAKSWTFGTQFTISAWIKTAASGEQPAVSNRNGGAVYFGTTGNSGFLYQDNCKGGLQGGTVSDNTFHLLTFVRTTDGSGHLYIDGSLIISDAPAGCGGTTGSQLTIGWDPSNITEYFSGSIDDVRIYNRALSAAEVQGIYNDTR